MGKQFLNDLDFVAEVSLSQFKRTDVDGPQGISPSEGLSVWPHPEAAGQLASWGQFFISSHWCEWPQEFLQDTDGGWLSWFYWVLLKMFLFWMIQWENLLWCGVEASGPWCFHLRELPNRSTPTWTTLAVRFPLISNVFGIFFFKLKFIQEFISIPFKFQLGSLGLLFWLPALCNEGIRLEHKSLCKSFDFLECWIARFLPCHKPRQERPCEMQTRSHSGTIRWVRTAERMSESNGS